MKGQSAEEETMASPVTRLKGWRGKSEGDVRGRGTHDIMSLIPLLYCHKLQKSSRVHMHMQAPIS